MTYYKLSTWVHQDELFPILEAIKRSPGHVVHEPIVIEEAIMTKGFYVHWLRERPDWAGIPIRRNVRMEMRDIDGEERDVWNPIEDPRFIHFGILDALGNPVQDSPF